MNTVIALLLAISALLIILITAFHIIKNMSRGWFLFCVFQAIILGAMFIVGIIFMLSLNIIPNGTLTPFSYLGIILFCEFVIAVTFRVSFLARFLYYTKPDYKRKSSEARTEAKNLFLQTSW